MKKFITIFAAISMLAVSCQKENILNDDENTGITTGKLTATMMPKTKVSYTWMDYIDYEEYEWPYDKYDEDVYQYGLLPAWEVGDKIIGFNNDGRKYTLNVDSVSEDGVVATLSGTVPANGDLHLIYKYGAQASDISDKSLTVDYSGQAGDKTMPAVMVADGTVIDGSCDFTFKNAGAVIGIWLADDLSLGSKVTRITLSGKNLSAATIVLDDVSDTLKITATPNDDDAISIDGLDLTVVEDDYWGNILSSPVWIAVPVGAEIAQVSVEIPKPVASLDPAREGTDFVTIAGKKWAKWNIGADNEKDYGSYFYWGSTKGYFWYKSTSVYPHYYSWRQLPKTTADVYSYSNYDTDCTVEAGKYYNCDPRFEYVVSATEYEFEWEFTPFNYGISGKCDTLYFKGVMDTVCPIDEDGYRTLSPDYDVAHLSWGGTWRMPTWDDFNSLIVACGGTPIDNPSLEETEVSPYTPAELSSANPGKGIYWVSAEQTLIADYTGVDGVLFCDGTSKLFFPAAGAGNNNNLSNSPIEGNYWTSNLNAVTSGFGNARALHFVRNELKMDRIKRRSFGFPIRAVSE